MMRYLALFAVLAASVSGILLYLYCRHERQKELYRMEMLRSTKLYKHLHAALVSCRADSRDLDQVRIERDRITLTLVDPPHVLIQFDLHQAGFAKMSRVRTRVMAEVLAEDISILLDRSKYSLRRYFTSGQLESIYPSRSARTDCPADHRPWPRQFPYPAQ